MVLEDEVGDTLVEGDLGQTFKFVIRPEEVNFDAGHHFGDRLVGNIGESFFAEAKEVEIGGIAQVEELKVILPPFVSHLQQPVVGDLQIEVAADATPLGDPFQVNHGLARRVISSASISKMSSRVLTFQLS